MIKRAEAEKAIEVLNILNIVAGKVFAVPVLKKTAGILFHDASHHISNLCVLRKGRRKLIQPRKQRLHLREEILFCCLY